MIRFAENLNKMITAGLGGALEAPRTEVAVGHCIRYLEASGPVASFESNIAAPIRNLRVDMHPIQAGSGDPSPDNIRPITGRDSVTVTRTGVNDYHPGNVQSATIQLGQTVYGGTVDVTTGEMVVDRAMVDLGSLSWNYEAQDSTFMSTNHKEMKFNSIPVCSQYKGYPVISIENLPDFGMLIGNSQAYPIIRVKDSRYTDAATFKNAMNGVQLVYKLATPITIDLTPAQLTTLKGQNNVWSDAGDVTLEYPYYEETEGY